MKTIEMESKYVRMRYNLDQKTKKTVRVRKLFAAALVMGGALGTAATAAQNITPPSTPAIITPPAGNSAFLLGRAQGTQGYVCLPQGAGASWTVNNARQLPFQTFFGQDVQIITYFSARYKPQPERPKPAGLAAQRGRTPSMAARWGRRLHRCYRFRPGRRKYGAIACLLLESIGSQTGPTGGKILSKTTFVQRLNTKGGSAPFDGCSVSTDVGKQTLVPYTADYYFFRKQE
jgi:hypothetical protein